MRLARSLKTTGFSLCNCHMGSLNVGMGGREKGVAELSLVFLLILRFFRGLCRLQVRGGCECGTLTMLAVIVESVFSLRAVRESWTARASHVSRCVLPL